MKKLSFDVYKRTGIGVFEPEYASLDIPGPTPDLKLDEAVSGDPSWTADVTMRILQMIRDQRAVLSR